ncbi:MULTISPECIES: STAS domain-containing protein [Mycobacterium]|uniref:Anti-anti-sigma factor n=1 Tax=Mycobacterium kiyosense TaxID=2871094 RepID=A0A9P3Q511_9MYCO|nr:MULTISPECIES: STAS domain-containing protein [Mycobacterium]BDB41030.1 anti-anti-sigma factor [Mycobacterium kiyosense]BDE12827.1 anti-anti-sigma factor [Mycobacterium sp. 20KCMC460]GLB82501.1 anti-anti-sigma factor [Mycobacterium kiyosense]GLB90294.1 anti-anti-sigma factor [Mycobacterium kiyosense]GLB93897.1 anti-anti-sigma factor [Mycobacterium kiyosense]
MATPLHLNTDRGADGTPRVIATGEIDLSNIATFTRALADAGGGTRRPITVDLSAVRYLDSAGINALFDHADAVDHLRVIVHPLLVRVLTVSGFSKIATVESAPASTDGASGLDSP